MKTVINYNSVIFKCYKSIKWNVSKMGTKEEYNLRKTVVNLFYRNDWAEYLIKRWMVHIIKTYTAYFITLYFLAIVLLLYWEYICQIPLVTIFLTGAFVSILIRKYTIMSSLLDSMKKYKMLYNSSTKTIHIESPTIIKDIPLFTIHKIEFNLNTTKFYTKKRPIIFEHPFLFVNDRLFFKEIKKSGYNIQVNFKMSPSYWKKHQKPYSLMNTIHSILMIINIALFLYVFPFKVLISILSIFPLVFYVLKAYSEIQYFTNTELEFINWRGLFYRGKGKIIVFLFEYISLNLISKEILISGRNKIYKEVKNRYVKVKDASIKRHLWSYPEILNIIMYSLESNSLTSKLVIKNIQVDKQLFNIVFLPQSHTIDLYRVLRRENTLEERYLTSLKYDEASIHKYISWLKDGKIHQFFKEKRVNQKATEFLHRSERGKMGIRIHKVIRPTAAEKRVILFQYLLTVLMVYLIFIFIGFMALPAGNYPIIIYLFWIFILTIIWAIPALIFTYQILLWPRFGIRFESQWLILWNKQKIHYKNIKYVSVNPNLGHITLHYIDNKRCPKRIHIPPMPWSIKDSKTKAELIETFKKMGIDVI